ncbi:uncharacterized protein VTP21DRAFT_7983 [Calcarisporiella thermophila]|uniref:uncharacterized protein n=1 Tax=Calcarisporiella thermophila TaxID=911321 RepID=UPI0037434A14
MSIVAITEKNTNIHVVNHIRESLQSHRKRLHVIVLAWMTIRIIGYFYFRLPSQARTSKKYCTEPVCLETAASILGKINVSVSPCDNFYEFVCGRFKEYHHIPPNAPKWRISDETQEENLLAIRDILESGYDGGSVGNLTKEEARSDREAGKVEKLMSLLKLVLEGFPLPHPLPDYYSGELDKRAVDEDKDVKKSLGAVLGLLANYGVNGLFQYDSWPDVNVTRLWLTQPVLGLPVIDYYRNETIVNAYSVAISESFTKIVNDVAVWPEAHPLDPSIWKLVSEEIIDFEKQLIEHILPPQQIDRVDHFKNPMSITMLQHLSPILDWRDHFKQLYSKVAVAPLNVDVFVSGPEYIGNLSTIVENTRASTLQAFLLWRTIREYVEYLPEQYSQPLRNLKDQISGTKHGSTWPRWRTCIDEVSQYIWHVPARHFALRRFDPDSRHGLAEMLENIRQEFIFKLPYHNWLDDRTRANALKIAQKLVFMAGYPSKSPDLMCPSDLQRYYAKFNVPKDDFLGTGVAGRTFKFTKFIQRLGNAPDRFSWEMASYAVNAYTHLGLVHIAIPSGIAQPPYFHSELPAYLNYGALGSIHEFDDQGRLFDQQGAVHDWWSEASSRQFEKKAQCFVDQYSNFTISTPDGRAVAVDGRNTLGENIADNGGTLQAYYAWKRALKHARHDPLLPGLEHFTPEQLFFITWAGNACGFSTPARQLQEVLTNEHSPAVFRVNGVAMNSVEFARAWNCPLGSNMNPKRKCNVW